MEVDRLKNRIIFDPIYGFITLTPVEWEIIHSPFYQRLRWIRQLGFSSYIFHGAEHSRYGHSIGAMNNAHAILRSCQVRVVSDEDLLNPKVKTKEKTFHQSVRLGALMHDLGTFPFSHTTEMAYVKFGETVSKDKNTKRSDDHENLGSFIIKNTNYEGGITHILNKYGYDPQTISDLVKGVDPSVLANQILHSEIDCDRMDYLLRDAYYTGLKYGSYDRDYLLHHFATANVAGHDILTIQHNALHCVEDFLNSRFAWYSQVVRSARGAKYDAVAERLCFYLLEKKLIYRYSDLLDMVTNRPMEFYKFNDMYFMGRVHELYLEGKLDDDPAIKEMAECLLLEKSPRVVRLEEFNQRLLSQNDKTANEKVVKRAMDKYQEIEDIVNKKGSKGDWVIPDIPKKNIIFVRSHSKIVKDVAGGSSNILLERDPVKIKMDNGKVRLLAEVEDSTISYLQNVYNFIPNVFCSESVYNLLIQEGIIEEKE